MEEAQKKAKKCPHCGSRIDKTNLFEKLLIGILILMIIGVVVAVTKQGL